MKDADAMHKISYGLYVVTTKVGEKDNGCISNTAIQAASSPNQLSVAINKANLTHDMILESGFYNVSTIAQTASFELFKRFGFQSGRDVDKFAGFEGVGRAENGALYVTEGTNSFFSVRVTKTVDLGSHTLFIGEVTEMQVLSDAESATYAYYHKNIKPKPQPVAQRADGKTVWRCAICGYEYVGDEIPDDFICPICKHPKADFEKVVAPAAPVAPVASASEGGAKTVWRCSVCGYEHVGDALPDDFKCPVCGRPKADFKKVEATPAAADAPAATAKTVWRCSVCGYEHVGDELPDNFKCPICGRPKEDFRKVSG